ncbi:cytochrome P450 98A2-like [Selaginella moellendorffii]|uniref:cytochrome P450 98A2-like n=1 Tax=Selaginella moellendorffii TaxID=88036 RepID=UPI000D1D1166|nr:cytochrome P450 98A2-like [Selaginella moellendorffii]|eukprot:XP_024540816.1 cytochrome P450 98A2-like [Selaginella moellendorffii]
MLTLAGENKLSDNRCSSLTSRATIEWAVSELILNPRIQERAHEELDRVVGRDRSLEEWDLKDLPCITPQSSLTSGQSITTQASGATPSSPPERFLGSDHSVLGNDFDLLPYSSGRRRCVESPCQAHLRLPLASMELAIAAWEERAIVYR